MKEVISVIQKAVREIIEELIITLVIAVIVGLVLLITSCIVGIPVFYCTGAFDGFYVGSGVGVCLCLLFYYKVNRFMNDVIERYTLEHSN